MTRTLGWLVAPLCLLAAIAAGVVVIRGPLWIAGVGLGVVLGGGFVWILLSTFWPSKPDRKCPKCGRESLRALSEDTTRGVVCDDCGWSDETTSSFYMAEETEGDGSVETIVLRERELQN